MTKPTKSASTEEELLEALKNYNAYTAKYFSTRQTIFRGIVSGFAGFIGATILVAIIIWLLSQIMYIPIFGDLKFLLILSDYLQNNSSSINIPR